MNSVDRKHLIANLAIGSCFLIPTFSSHVFKVVMQKRNDRITVIMDMETECELEFDNEMVVTITPELSHRNKIELF